MVRQEDREGTKERKMTRSDIALKNAYHHDLSFVTGKVAEEAAEVSLAFIHLQTKPEKMLEDELYTEIAHLRVSLDILNAYLVLIGPEGQRIGEFVEGEMEHKYEEIRMRMVKDGFRD